MFINGSSCQSTWLYSRGLELLRNDISNSRCSVGQILGFTEKCSIHMTNKQLLTSYLNYNTVFSWISAPPPPLFFMEIGGLACAKDRLLMLNLPPPPKEVTKTHTLLLLCLQTNAEFRYFSSPFTLSLFIFAVWSYLWPINNLFTCGLLRQMSKACWTARVRWCNYGHYTPIGNHWGVRLYGCLTTPLLQKIFPNSTHTVLLFKRIRYSSMKCSSPLTAYL